MMQTWKDGKLKPCTVEEFTQGLRRLAGWADKEFSYKSDPAAHLGERLNAAADLIGSITLKRS